MTNDKTGSREPELHTPCSELPAPSFLLRACPRKYDVFGVQVSATTYDEATEFILAAASPAAVRGGLRPCGACPGHVQR